ncbi:hypothetical protein BC937DRAFT_89479 [Endogone sp. FLAS-F59071]|nr:hypothetical protein BC937DRAFT_89479 [Endogone sp. FLAS-F59071]|eukprot:RUS17797.1 hypothetical protein BC937DRAFT_89479 [Endogone sp. FLAS-F59071]
MPQSFTTTRYLVQNSEWPANGRHILGHHDANSVIVYQAYKPSIGHYAAKHQKFTGAPDFSATRMTWIKPNFLWMMYRNGWGVKRDQEVTLAVRLKRSFFEELLATAVPSTFVEALYGDRETWKMAVERSDVRLQWDPDHGPTGKKMVRRAIQLGMRGEMAARYASGEEIVSIEDVSEFVEQQRVFAMEHRWEELEVPTETEFVVGDEDVNARLGIGIIEQDGEGIKTLDEKLERVV